MLVASSDSVDDDKIVSQIVVELSDCVLDVSRLSPDIDSVVLIAEDEVSRQGCLPDSSSRVPSPGDLSVVGWESKARYESSLPIA